MIFFKSLGGEVLIITILGSIVAGDPLITPIHSWLRL
jgi:hypothetical protein